MRTKCVLNAQPYFELLWAGICFAGCLWDFYTYVCWHTSFAAGRIATGFCVCWPKDIYVIEYGICVHFVGGQDHLERVCLQNKKGLFYVFGYYGVFYIVSHGRIVDTIWNKIFFGIVSKYAIKWRLLLTAFHWTIATKTEMLVGVKYLVAISTPIWLWFHVWFSL